MRPFLFIILLKMLSHMHISLLGFAAYSGVGKTTLLKQLIPLLKRQGLSIGLIKHSHHDFEIDIPGKDSYELRKAGAEQVALVSAYRQVVIKERQKRQEPTLEDAVQQLDQTGLDLILVEGFRDTPFPKIELHRPSLGKRPLYPEDETIIAVATDDISVVRSDLPVLDLNNSMAIADFIRDWMKG